MYIVQGTHAHSLLIFLRSNLHTYYSSSKKKKKKKETCNCRMFIAYTYSLHIKMGCNGWDDVDDDDDGNVYYI